ncbi:hypothetical protein [Actinomadura rugatobispora]|uniref:Uncharacterized protein n=1 Tax=Actinomadura rugatobispora TaxID=1994 RepID=A0ABW1A7S7_9ACTN|nr:hypothetical protein GCM10010200_041630 [Actinomadura rugatobispora]
MPLPPRCRGGERRRYRELVLGGSEPPGTAPGPRRPPRVLAGTVLDASPHLLVLRGSGGEVRLPMTSATSVWHGGRGGLAALLPGREVIVRSTPDGLGADRIWVDIGRVTGTILARGRDAVEVDMGPHRGRTHVVIPPHALGRVLVRHPRLEPGFLIDVICVRSPAGPQAVRPGTSQPGHRAADLAAPEPDVSVPQVLQGTATWFGGATYEVPAPRAEPDTARPDGDGAPLGRTSPGAEALPHIDGAVVPTRAESGRGRCGPRHASSTRRRGPARPTRRRPEAGVPEARPDARAAGPDFRLSGGAAGAAYPALDPEGQGGGCPDAPPPGCAALPYLSLGSELVVRNECADLTATLPVIECGCVAAGYCDRCVECGTSPRGRLVELTPAAFVGLGGDLDAGCFNTVLRHGAPGAAAGV